MTVSDLRCDVCGTLLGGLSGWPGPAGSPPSPAAAGIRFVYHPGAPELRDDSGLMCEPCWEHATRDLNAAAPARCARCGTAVARRQSLHLRRFDDPEAWRLCAPDAAGFLNSLRTVTPKLDPATFRLPEPPRSS